jgi:hypothetical protein
MKKDIIKTASRAVHKFGFKCKKHSPELLLIMGITAGIVGTVVACKATTKAESIIADSKERMTIIKDEFEKAQNDSDIDYSEEDMKKDKYIVFVQTGVQIVKAYALPIALGTISITSILASHNIIRKRNAALASAYTLIDRSFKDYRGRVVDRFGEQVDRELRYDIKAVEVEKTAVNSKGKEVKVKDTEKVVDPNKLTDYARIFYSGNPGYDDDDPQYTLMHLRSIQNMMNDRLKAHGHVFLNEAYAALGFQPTKEGQIVGWVYDEKNPVGDNFIDFGIYDLNNIANCRFLDGIEKGLLLDFNVDGPILDMI